MMDADEAQASLDEIRERERQSTEQAIREGRPQWWYSVLALPAAIAAGVLLDLADQDVVPSWVPAATAVGCLVLVAVMLWLQHGSTRIETRHRPPGWFYGVSFVVLLVVVIGADQVARAVGSPWLHTVNLVTIVIVVCIQNLVWRRLALRAAARERDAA